MTNGSVNPGQLESHLWEAAKILRGPVRCRRLQDLCVHTAAEFYTNRTVVHLMNEILIRAG